jgi:hypothetical protein
MNNSSKNRRDGRAAPGLPAARSPLSWGRVRREGTVQPFTVFYSLFGLVLGLSLAAVLSGFARVLRMRPRVHMGLLVPLLGLFVMLDLISFWNGAWQARDWMDPGYGYLFIALVVTGIYYIAASSVFPEAAKTVAEYDAHYFENRRWILPAIGFCNLAVFGWQYLLEIRDLPFSWWVAIPGYFALLITAAVTPSRRVSIACLAGLIGIYLFLTFKSLTGSSI